MPGPAIAPAVRMAKQNAQRTEMDRPLWYVGFRREELPALAHDLEVDVVIAGGGITGLTAAILIASQGQRVALLEADRIGSGTSGATSAQVTAVPDFGYRALLSRWGAAAGTEYVVRLNAALEFMDSLVVAERIACDWRRVPGYWFSEDDAGRLRAEHQAAQQLGQSGRLLREAPLPWATAGAIELDDQALFHPLRYLAGLTRVARARSALLFERSPVRAWHETGAGVVVHTPAATVRARALILATHVPLGFNLVQTELRATQSHIVALALRDELPDALFWDTADPYHYLRPATDDGRPVVLVGGGDHKTGHGEPFAVRDALLDDYVWPRFGALATLTRWWSAQLFEPADGLPYIGRSPLARHVYLATGFAGVGLVQGTMAAMELAAQLGGEAEEGPWRPNRLAISATPRLVAEGLDNARCWVGDRLAAHPGSVEELAPGEGAVLTLDGERRAVFRDDGGGLHVLSAVCPHLGCLVRWNGAARSWDCPCHGSRFAATGAVLEGPSLRGLLPAGAPAAAAPADDLPEAVARA